MDSKDVIDSLEISKIHHQHGVVAGIHMFKEAFAFPDKALSGIAFGQAVIVFVLEEAVKLLPGLGKKGGNGLAVSHCAKNQGVAGSAIFQNHIHCIDGLVDFPDGIHIGLGSLDLPGHRTGRAGLVQVHEAAVALLALLQLGIDLQDSVVAAYDVVVFVYYVDAG